MFFNLTICDIWSRIIWTQRKEHWRVWT